jgi:hypothetical protein
MSRLYTVYRGDTDLKNQSGAKGFAVAESSHQQEIQLAAANHPASQQGKDHPINLGADFETLHEDHR